MTTLTMPARPEEDAPACGRCRGGGWPGSPGGSTGSRWPAWPCSSARWRCTCGITGLQLHHAYAAAAACHPASSLACGTWTAVQPAGTALPANRLRALQAVPALIGAFAGAPVLARELETGTFRYAWTQGFGRWRWTLGKLVPLAVAVAAAARRLSVLFSWYYQPFFAARYGPDPARRPAAVRPARGRVRRLDAGRLRDRRPGRNAHPPGRPRDRRHPGGLRRARPR